MQALKIAIIGLIFLLIQGTDARVCSSNATDTPATTGCNYCAFGTNEGCSNGGVCYNQTVPFLGTIPFCGCPVRFAPPRCEQAIPVPPICNSTSTPASGCVYCDPTAPVGAQGCQNGGQCYYQPTTGVPPPGLPLCGCLVGFNPPQCATVAAPLPFCNATDPTSMPPSCLYCDPRLPAGQDGCFNGGSCYYAPVPGAPPTGIPVCGCPYGFAPPSCFNRAAPLRLCNASDPTNPLENPPNCQFCDPALSNQPNGNNGCIDYGFCSLQDLQGPGIPPNTQLPICVCQPGLTPPQCAVPFLTALGRPDLVSGRFGFGTGFLICLILAAVVVGQHIYYAYNYKLTNTNISKLIGSVLIFFAALCLAIDEFWNPAGQVLGYPTVFNIQSAIMLTSAFHAFLTICVAINTANWIRIGLAAVSPSYRGSEKWPLIAHVVVWTVVVYSVVIAITFSVLQVDYDGFRVAFYVAAGTILVLLIFSVISGTFVLVTINNIDTADPKLLRKTALQLCVVGAGELICAILMILIVAVDWSLQPVTTIWGVTICFNNLVRILFLLLLLVQFRIATWQLKEVALTRGNTATNMSSARETAQSYKDDHAEDSGGEEVQKKSQHKSKSRSSNASSGQSSDSTSKDKFSETGIIEL